MDVRRRSGWYRRNVIGDSCREFGFQKFVNVRLTQFVHKIDNDDNRDYNSYNVHRIIENRGDFEWNWIVKVIEF